MDYGNSNLADLDISYEIRDRPDLSPNCNCSGRLAESKEYELLLNIVDAGMEESERVKKCLFSEREDSSLCCQQKEDHHEMRNGTIYDPSFDYSPFAFGNFR